LLNINLTLAIQLVTFLVLAVLLNLLLFKPVLRVLDRREKVLRDSRSLREEFTRLAEEKTKVHDERILVSRQEALALRGEARSQASGALRGMVQQARDQHLSELERARKTIAAGAEQARGGMRPLVESLAREFSSALAGRALGGKR
jgi:F-type H+-transporting ATPase subunit b